MAFTVPAQQWPRNRPGNRLLRIKARTSSSKEELRHRAADAFIAATPGRYLPLSDEALRLAADLWAKARQEGRPTADVTALDIDVFIAAQALSFGPAPADVTVATTNPKHMAQFVSAKHWADIVL